MLRKRLLWLFIPKDFHGVKGMVAFCSAKVCFGYSIVRDFHGVKGDHAPQKFCLATRSSGTFTE